MGLYRPTGVVRSGTYFALTAVGYRNIFNVNIWLNSDQEKYRWQKFYAFFTMTR